MLIINDSFFISTLSSKVVYDMDSGNITADLSPSKWIGTGYEDVVSAVIDILDKNGNIIKSQTIYPPMTDVVTAAIPTQDGIYKWGEYTVRVTLDDGTNQYVDNSPYNLIPPEKPNKNTGTIDINIRPNRTINKTGVFASVPPPYNDAEVSSYIESGMYYYPNGSDFDNVPIVFTPFEVAWAQGRSEVQMTILATYVFSDNVSVIVKYTGDVSKQISGVNDLCLAWAAIKDLLARLEVDCDSETKSALNSKLDMAVELVVLISVGNQCGYDVDNYVQELEGILGVGLTCNTVLPIEQQVLPAESIEITGCGVQRESTGLTTRYKIDNYQYVVLVTNGGSCIKQTNITDGCTKVTTLSFDWANISSLMLTYFEGAYNARFLNILNTALNYIAVPECIDTITSWRNKDFKAKFQKVLDVQCACCGTPIGGDFTFELDCDGAVVSGSYEIGTETLNETVVVGVQVTGAANVTASISGNGFFGVLASTAVNSSTSQLTIPFNYDGSGSGGLKNATITINTPSGQISCLVPVVVTVPASCSAPISPSVSIIGSTVTVSFFPATNEPPSYEVMRRWINDPDEPGSYVLLPTPTYNVGLGKYQTTETYDSDDVNKLWVYKVVSLCSDPESRPYNTTVFVTQTCPTLTLTAGEDAISYSYPNVGGDTNQYRVALYLGSTLVGSVQTKTPPFSSPITGNFSGLSENTTYTIKVFVEIINGSDTYTKECSQTIKTAVGVICKEYYLLALGFGTVGFKYTNCAGDEVVDNLFGGAETVVCARQGTVSQTTGEGLFIRDQGYC